MPGSEPATASTQQDRRTLLHGELNALQADGKRSERRERVSAVFKLPKFSN